ncbi:hypothetical protein K32_34410 [Kaistia sp. 32K]|uniref:hypothetical protein n=1 Tax=Kaistia sp. 32K TaxID=2795690 RepID=UPI0019166BE2|nr:hypothetical protein [Kaistia sp. 32K]BCP54824.1 hypothetical protein K32_34410 [Kaistia sp. 32K]
MRSPDGLRHLGRVASALVLLALLVAPASAHRLKVFASAIGGNIEGEAYFVGSGPAADISVTLRDNAGKPLQTGMTGADGRFALPVSATGDVQVIVDAHDGHIARFTVAGDAAAPPAAPPSPEGAAAPAAAPAQATVPLAEIELAVARKVAPLAEQIDALESSLRLRDIIGGVGYIVGLFGLLAFVKSRRKGDAA